MPFFKRSQKAPSEEKTHILSRITALAKTLAGISDFDEILRLSGQEAKQFFHADEALILVMNPRTRKTVKAIFDDGSGNKKRQDENVQLAVNNWVYQHAASFFSSDVLNDARLADAGAEEFDIRSIMATALKAENRFFGSLMLFNRGESAAFSESALDLLDGYGAVISPYLRNSQKIKEYFAQVSDKELLAESNEFGLKGNCKSFQELVKSIHSAAKCTTTVFMQGATGTGKEMIALAIHKFSARREAPFVAVDFKTIPETMIKSELFGYKKGAFTGAAKDYPGLIAAAHGGVLFLDEVQNIPLEQQTLLLRFLENREVRPVGDTKAKQVNVRIIAASQIPLQPEIKEGRFREDLFYRLYIYHFRIPDLAQRQEDIPLLADHFLDGFLKEQNKTADGLDDAVLEFIKRRSWGGNIRELRNFMERLIAFLPEGAGLIKLEHLSEEFQQEAVELQKNAIQKDRLEPLSDLVAEIESKHIRKALVQNNWNQSSASKALGVAEGTIRYKMEKYSITKP